jgi:hypothetical protein
LVDYPGKGKSGEASLSFGRLPLPFCFIRQAGLTGRTSTYNTSEAIELAVFY